MTSPAPSVAPSPSRKIQSSVSRPLPRNWLRSWRSAAILSLALLSVPAFVAWESLHAVRQARAGTLAAALLPATVRILDRPLPADLEPIPSRFAARDATLLHGHLFVAGPQGIVEHDSDGTVLRRFRTGLELPPAAIVSLGAGTLAAHARPELVIATDGEGLLTFDGRRFEHVLPEAAEYRRLTSVLVLSSGRVLVGTQKSGVLAYDGRELTRAHPELAGAAVTALAGSDGDVWIGTVDRGVWHWHAGGIDRFDSSRGLPDPRVLSIAVGGSRAFAGTAVGIAEFERGQYVRTIGDGLFASALAVRHRALVVGTLDDGIAEFDLTSRLPRGARPIIAEGPAAIERFIEADGALYGVARDGVHAVDGRPARFRRVAGDESGRLTDGNVSALAVDGRGRLWVGYFDRGLDLVAERAVTHVEDDRIFCVNRIVHDAASGITAVATANGLALFDAAGTIKEMLGRAEGLIADHVTDVILNAGRMAVATPAGLTFVESGGSRSLYAFHGLVNNHVYSLASAGREVLAGTLGGLSVVEDGVVHASYTSANSPLTHNWITALARVDEEWFVGTYGGGLFRLDERGSWHRFPDLAGAIEVNANAMAVTDTHVFAGTLSRGLLVYDRRSGRWNAFDEGLPSRNVTALASDRTHVYVGTDNGVVRISAHHFGS